MKEFTQTFMLKVLWYVRRSFFWLCILLIMFIEVRQKVFSLHIFHNYKPGVQLREDYKQKMR